MRKIFTQPSSLKTPDDRCTTTDHVNLGCYATAILDHYNKKETNDAKQSDASFFYTVSAEALAQADPEPRQEAKVINDKNGFMKKIFTATRKVGLSLILILFTMLVSKAQVQLNPRTSASWNNIDTWVSASLSGTITSNTANATVTISGSTFTALGIANGDKIYKSDGTTLIGTVSVVNTSTSLTLTANALSTNAGIAWKIRRIPNVNDDVFYLNASPTCDLTLDANSSCNSFFISNRGTLTINGTNILNVTAGVTSDAGPGTAFSTTIAVNAGTLTCASLTALGGGNGGDVAPINITTGTITVSGNITLTSSAGAASINITSTGTLNVGGTFTNNGVLSAVSGSTVNFSSGSSQTIPQGTYGNITNSGNGNRTLQNSGTIGIAGSFSIGSGTYTTTGSTVDFNGVNSQIIPASFAYNNLTVSNSSSTGASPTNNLTVNGTCSVTGFLNLNTSTVSGATFTLGLGGTLGIGSTLGITTLGTPSGNILSTTARNYNVGGNYKYIGTSNQVVGTGFPTNLTGSITIDNTGNIVTLDNPRTIASAGTVNLTNGTFAAGTNLSMGTTSTIARSGGSITGTLQGVGIYNVTYSGSSKQTGPELGNTGLLNVTLNLTAGQTLTLDQSRIPDGNLIINTGIFDLGTFTIDRSVPGAGTVSVGAGATLRIGGTNTTPGYNIHTYASTSTVEYYGGAQIIGGGDTYGNLIVGGGTKTTTQNVSNIAGDFTCGTGCIVNTADAWGSGAGISGNWTVNGQFNQSGGTTTFVGGGSTHNISGTGYSQFAALTTSNSTINANSHDIRITNNWTHGTGGIFNAQTSKVTFNGTSGQTVPSAVFAPSFYDLTVNVNGANISTSRVWTVTNNFQLDNSNSFAPLTTSTFKNVTINGGTFTAPAVIDVTGDWNFNGGVFTPSGGNVNFSGGAQNIGGSAPTVFATATLAGSADKTLTNNIQTTGTLALGSKNLNTGTNTAYSTTVTRSSGYVKGNLKKDFSSGSLTRTFEIGRSNYIPVDLTFTSVTTPGTITATVNDGDHANVNTSGINSTKSVNYNWTLTNSATVFGTATATFRWIGVGTDADAGSNTANYIVAKYNSPNWTLPTVANKTATSIQATGIASFSDFEVGEAGATCTPVAIQTCPGALNIPGCNTGAISSAGHPAFSTSQTTISAGTFTTEGGTIASGSCTVSSIKYQDVSSGSCPTTVTRTYTVTDINNATATCQQIITVADNTVPTASNPAAVNVQCIGLIPAANPLVVNDEADNCSTPTVTLFNESNNNGSGNPGDPYIVTRIYRVTDACGNHIDVTQTLTALDNTNPTASNPPSHTYQCFGDLPDPDPSVVINEADNCGIQSVTFQGVENNGGLGCFDDPYIETRTYRVTDIHGNYIDVTQILTVQDNTPPVLINSSVGCSSLNQSNLNQCLSAATAFDAHSLEAGVAALYNDNCLTSVIATLTGTTPGGTNSNCSWSFVYHFRISDDCGNYTSCDVTYSGGDTAPPTLSGTLPGGAVGSVCKSNAPTAPSTASIAALYTDNCSSATAALISSSVTGTDCSWTATYTYSIKDACNNAASNAVVVYTGGDVTAPSLTGTLPGGAQGSVCKSNAPAAPSTASIAAQYTDNCSAVTASLISSSVSGTDCSWTATYTYSIKDACNNATSNAVIVYTGGDVTAPSLAGTLPGGASGNLCKSAATSAPSTASIEALYTDNCSEAHATLASSSVTGDNCSWTATYTYHVADACGNATADAVVVYTGGDTQAPTRTGTLPGGASGNLCKSAAPTAPSTASIEALYTDNCSEAHATLASSSVTGDNCSWTATYTYHVADACGNAAADAVVVYTGGDTQAPTRTGTLPGGASGNLCKSAAPTAPSTASIEALYTDNCSEAHATLASSSVTGDNCSWTATYTYHVADACGNAAANAVVVYTGGDTQAPTLTGTIPGGASGNLCKSSAPTAPSTALIEALYTDNCSEAHATLASSSVTGDNCSWTATYTYHVADACGNAAVDAVVVYTGGDTEAPTRTGTLPGGASGNLCKSAAPTAPSTASIEALYTDNCSEAHATLASSSVTGDNCSWTATYTYHVADACGNAAANAIVVYTGGDTEAPTRTGTLPGGASGNLCKSAAPTAPSTASIEALYTDNCSEAHATLASSSVTGDNCSWTATYTYHVADACGNAAADAVVVYTGGDTEAPSLVGTLPGGASGNLCKSAAPTAPSTASIEALYTDNCSEAHATLASSSVTGDNCSWTATYTYHVADACGNAAADAVVVYTGGDTQAPTLSGTIPGGAQGSICKSAAPTAPSTASIEALYTDNCSEAHATLASSSVTGTDCNWTATYTYHVADACGNAAADAVVVYTGGDTTPPSLNGTLPGGAVGSVCKSNAPTAPSEASIAALYTDNCSSATATLLSSSVIGTDCNWTATYTYSIKDACNNAAANAVVVYTGGDTTPPSLSGTLPGGAVGSVCKSNAPTAPSEASIAALYTDNCSSVTAILVSSSVTGSDCNWTATYTYSIKDACDNAPSDAVVVYTGGDTTPPSLTGTIPGGDLGNTCKASAPTAPSTSSIAAQYSDNCSAVTATLISSVVNGTNCSWTATYTYSIKDACNNATANAVVVYIGGDTEAPSLVGTIPGGASGNLCKSAAPTAPSTASIEALYTDNCSEAHATLASSSVTGDNCSWTATYTYHVADACGNAAADAVVVYTGGDTQAPTFTKPADITIHTDANCAYDASPANTGDVTNEADNCSTGLQATYTDAAPVAGSCAGSYTITRTWHLVDDCNNHAADQVQIITVTDNTAPTFTAPAAATIHTDANCAYDASVANTGDVTNEHDNCDQTLQATYTDAAPVAGSCAGSYTITRTWHLVDCSGNAAADQTQVITVTDNTAPTFTAPAAATIHTDANCAYDASVANTGDVTNEHDNCDQSLQATYTDAAPVAGSCAGSYTITRTWHLVDCSGNAAADQTQVITVTDNTAPTFTAPAAATIHTDANCAYDASVANTGDVTNEHDNCDQTLQATYTDAAPVAGSCAGSYTITRTWHLVDCSGNAAADQTQVITVTDNTAPTFTAPAAATIHTDANCAYDASVANTGDVTNEHDNCDQTLQATFTDAAPVAGSCAGSYTITRTWHLVDCSGNAAADQTQVITVTDNTAPTFTAPAAATIHTDANCAYDASVANTGDVTNEHDNCDQTLQATFTDAAPVAGSCAGSYTITRTWHLVDCSGNAAADQTQVITITDNTAPTFTAPAAATIHTDANCAYDASVANTGDVTNEHDNCDQTLQATFTDAAPVAGSCAGSYTITRTWHLVDCSGNAAADQTQVITVTDNTAPTFTAPAAATIHTDANCAYDASVANTGDVTNEHDNCDQTLQATFTDAAPVAGSCAGSYTITRTWHLVDCSGNAAADQTQVITVTDNTAPTFTAPAAATIHTDANCAYDASVANTGDVTNEHDNCDQTLQATFTDAAPVAGSCAGSYTITRTWHLVDCSGNAAADQTQVITVTDNTAPTFTAPAAATIHTDANCAYDASVANTGDVTNEHDNCDQTLQATYTDAAPVAGSCAGSYTITRTWHLVDCSGNAAADQTQVITVTDNTAPTFTAPAAATIHTDANCAYDASVANTGDVTNEHDNCDQTLQATFTDAAPVAGSCAGSYTITRTWHLVDCSGNAAADQTQVITVTDNTAPTFTAPAAATIHTDANCAYDASVANTGDVTNEHDNCDQTLQATFTDAAPVAGSCAGSYTITRTWHLVDCSGNAAADQTQVITVTDNTAPTFTAPAAATIHTDANCAYDASVANTGDVTNEHDNCDQTLQATFTDAAPVAGSCAGSYTITRTWHLVDCSGNAAADQTQVITVTDNTAPTFTAPAAATIHTDANCAYDASVANTGDVTNEHDNCDQTLQATFTDAAPVAGSCAGSYTITRTWHLVDCSGNAAADQTQVITVTDDTAPTFTAPADITIHTDANCDFDAFPTATGDVTDAHDNCDQNLHPTYSDIMTSTECGHTITRTWHLHDCSGNNAADQIQTITVTDNTAPTFTAPSAITIHTDANCAYNVSVAATGDVTDEHDNCATGLEATYSDAAPVAGACPGSYTITRTWSLVDHCGNHAADQTQIITVTDNTAPTFTAPADVIIHTDGSCNYDVLPAATGEVTDAHDNCDQDLHPTYSDIVTNTVCGHTITRTWHLSDCSGNAAPDQIQTISVTDNTPPVIHCPADLTVNCSDDMSTDNTGSATATDNCTATNDLIINYTESSTQDTDPSHLGHYNYVITRTWTATDVCGNSSSCDQHITVRDVTAPEIHCPANATVNCQDNNGPANTGVATATDNCDPAPAISHTDHTTVGDCPGNYTITRTWTATDVAGNTSSCDQIITVHDTTPPTITCPIDVTINCTESSAPANTGTATSNDNCGAGAISYSDASDQNPDPQQCGHYSYTINRTWMALDGCGNTSTCVQHIHVHDVTAPVQTGTLPGGNVGNVCMSNAPAPPDNQIANKYSDNCSPVQVSYDADFSGVTGDNCHWTATYTYHIYDVCGNQGPDAVVVYTGGDTEAPSLVGTLPGGASGNLCKSAATSAPSTTSIEALYTDNCSEAHATLASSSVTGDNCSWTATYTYHVADACGNAAADAVVVYTGGDTQAPSLVGTLPGGASGNLCKSAAPTAPTTASIEALYTDNCSEAHATLASSSVTGDNCSWTATYTYHVADACGNAAADAVVVYTGGDTEAPSLVGTLPGGASGNLCKSAAPTAPTTASIEALYTDNCSEAHATLASSSVTGDNCSWTATYTYHVADACGNAAANAVVVYTGGDTEAPSLVGTLPGGASGNLCKSAAPTAPTTASIEALYTDNCSEAHATLASSSVTGDNCSWTATYTYHVADACGNAAANAVVVYTGGDTEAPSLVGTLPGGASGNLCKSAAPTAPTTASIEALYTDNCSEAHATLASSSVTGDNCSWTATYTYHVADACGNAAADAVVVYTGGDTEAPSLVGTLPGGASGNLCKSAAPTAPSTTSIEALYTDNCSEAHATLASSSVTGDNCSWTATYTYHVADACGNAAADAVVVYTGGDTQAPSLVGTLPGGASGNLCKSAAPTAPSTASIEALYTDNCSEAHATLASSSVTGDNCSWTATYTYHVADACGNAAANAVVVYTGGDTEAPSLVGTIPGGPSGNLCKSAAPSAPTTASIEALYTDNCSEAHATLASSSVTGDNCSWTATYTYHVADACGNAAPDAVVVYTGGDTEAPSLVGTLPGGASGNLCKSAAPTAPTTASIEALYTDNCSEAHATLASSAVTGDNCSWTATYTYHVADACGNAAADAVVVYTGGDTEAPSLTGTLPGGASGNLCKSAAPTAPSTASIEALYTDNCSEAHATLASSSVTGDNCSWTATYTYHVADACGNAAADAVVVYTGGDTQAPSLVGTLPGGASGNLCKSAAPTAPSTASIEALYTDNCSEAHATLASSSVTGDNCSWTATYTYHVADACGNAAADAVVVYTGGDTQAPSLVGTLPGGASGNLCKSAAPTAPTTASIEALYTDNCSEAHATLASSSVTGDNCSWTATYTYHVADACGNAAADAVVVYTGGDTEAPSLVGTLPGGASGNLCKSAATSAPSTASIEALYTDNCSEAHATLASSSVTGDNCSWTATYTYHVADACGNAAADAVVVYTGGDTEAPSLVGTLPGGASGNLCKSAATSAPTTASIEALYTDNCSEAHATLASSSVTGDNCSWTATYTYHVADACGNAAADAVVVYTGGDTQAPSLVGTIPGGASGNLCKSAAPTAPSTASIEALYTDNCSEAHATLASSSVIGDNCSWTATYTYHVADACGNAAADAVVVYTGGDTQAPTLTGSLPGGASGNLCKSAAPTAPTTASIEALYTDNCSEAHATLASSSVTGDNCSWTATYTYHVADACGNAAADAVVVYTGGDTEAPSLVGTLPGGASGNLCKSAAPTAPTTASIEALYTDNCSEAHATLASSSVTGTDCSWTATYTYHVADACGNAAADAVVVYTGGDTEAPSLTGTIPSGQSGMNACYSNAPAGPTEADIAALYHDNCGTVHVTKSGTPSGNNCSWNVTYHYVITDDCGNAATAVDIAYDGGDHSAPVLTGSLPGQAGINGCYSSAPSAPLESTIAAQYSDCGNVTAELVTSNVSGDNCHWTATYTYKVKDGCGNYAADAVVTYTGGDTQPPVITCPASVSAQCGAVVPSFTGTATATDNCDPSPVITYTDSSVPGSCPGSYTLTRTWTATDACGNTASCNQTIAIADVTAPTFTAPHDKTISTDANCSYNISPAVTGDVTNEHDNCSTGLNATYTDSAPVAGSCPGAFTITRTWHLVDDCGNAAPDQVQHITVKDLVKPVLNCMDNQLRNTDPGHCTYATVGTEFDETATDNCSTPVMTWTLSGSTTGSGTGSMAGVLINKGSTLVTWTATDACGNFRKCSFRIRVRDQEDPILSCPTSITATLSANCSMDIAVPNPVYSDNCGVTKITWEMHGATHDHSPGSGINFVGTHNFNLGVTTVTYRVRDDSYNWVTCTFTVTILDNINPVIACPGDITANAGNNCKAQINPAEPTYSDNCSVKKLTWVMTGATVNQDLSNGINKIGNRNFNTGVTLVTYTAYDQSGNSATCSYTVTVVDNTAPTIDCPHDVTRNVTDNTCSKTFDVENPQVHDNCGVVKETWVMTGVTTDASPSTGINTVGPHNYNLGATLITYTIWDAKGNMATCSMTVTIVDDENPDINCPSSINTTLIAGEGCSKTINVPDPVYGDNCTVASLTWVLTGATTGSSGPGIHTLGSHSFNKGTTTVTYTITDGSGNTRNCSFTVKVTDNVLPDITCPTSIVADLTAGCSKSVIVSNPIATDNCEIESLTWEMNGATTGHSPNSGVNYVGTQTFNLGVTTITYKIKDASGNQRTCSFTVTVVDHFNPTVTCTGGNISTGVTNNCYAKVNVPDPTYTDNCTVTQLTWSMSGATTGSDLSAGINLMNNQNFNLGITTVTYTVKDGSGNLNTCSFTVTVTDNVAPTINCPNNVSANSTTCTKQLNINNPGLSDNCSVVSLTWVMTGATPGNSVSTGINYVGTQTFNIGVTNIMYTAKDLTGNTTTCSFSVTITDNQDPSINCPSNITTNVVSGCFKSIAVTNPSYSDNCGVVSLTWVMTGATTGSSLSSGINFVGTQNFNVGTTTVTYTAKDGSGNMKTCNFNVTVNDQINPTVTCPSPMLESIISGCSKSISIPAPGLADNCAVTILTWKMTGATSASSPSTGMNFVGLQTFNLGVTTITYTAKDASGNVGTCSYTVTVEDHLNPTVTCTGGNISANVTNNCYAKVNVPDPTYSDNCSVTQLTWSMTGATVASNLSSGINTIGNQNFNTGITTVTYTVKDGSGNLNTCNFTVTVTDNVPPTINCPNNVNNTGSTCTKSINISNPNVNDNCAVTSLTWTMSGASSGASGSSGVNYVGTQIFNVGTTTITYTAMDAAGLTAVCSFTVTYKENVKPTISCPASVTKNTDPGLCSASVAVANPVTNDNCGVTLLTWSMSGATVNNSPATGINTVNTQTFSKGVTTVTYTVGDASGNVSSCSFTVTVNDGQAPTLTCPGDQTFVKSPTNQYTIPLLSSSDNCGVISSTNYAITGLTIRSGSGNNASGTFNVGVSWIVWTVKDPANNQAICSTKVTVNPPLTRSNQTNPSTVGDGETVKTVIPNTLKLLASPNPSQYFFLLKISSDTEEPVDIFVHDISGRLMEQMKGSVLQTYRFGDRYMPGAYIVEVRQGAKRSTTKVIKQ